MGTENAFAIMAGSCGIVLFILLLRQRARFLLVFAVRAVLGAIGICFINDLLGKQGIMISVGLNPLSLLTAGSLGISGLALLYGVVACDFFVKNLQM